MAKVRIRPRDMAVPIFLLLIVDGAIILAWNLMAPLVWKRTVTDWDEKLFAPKKSYGECVPRDGSIDSWYFLGPILAIHVIVLIVGNTMAYKSRNIATSFHEGKWITIAMFGNLEMLILAFPIIIIVSNLPSASLFIRSAVVFFLNFGVLICIFMPKILNVAAIATDTAASTVAGTSSGESGNSGNAAKAVMKSSASMPQMSSKRAVNTGPTSGSPMRQKKKPGAAAITPTPTPFVNSTESLNRALRSTSDATAPGTAGSTITKSTTRTSEATVGDVEEDDSTGAGGIHV